MNNIESPRNYEKDPIQILIKKYPRIIVLKALFRLLDNNEPLNLVNMEEEVVKVLKK